MREEQFGRIGDLTESGLLHLVDAQFGCAAEAVLYGSEDAIHVMLVALELYDRVDDVLKDLGSGERTLLIDMSDKDDGCAGGLGVTEQGGGALPYLRDAAGAALHVLGGESLDGVDDQEFGCHFACALQYFLKGGLAKDVDIVRIGRRIVSPAAQQTLGSHLELMRAFLSADVEYALVGNVEDGLQGESALSDARFASEQHDAALDQASS